MFVMERYHVVQSGIGLCLYCGKWCEQCNQCKCEIGRVRVCPQFDTKKHPQQHMRWKISRDIERLERKLMYGSMNRIPADKRAAWATRICDEIDRLEVLRASDEVLYERRDKDGLAYYDR